MSMFMHDPFVVVSHVVVEDLGTGGFRTIIARRYQGNQAIEVRRVIPVDPPRERGLLGLAIDNARRLWAERQERRAIARRGQVVSVSERIKRLTKGKS